MSRAALYARYSDDKQNGAPARTSIGSVGGIRA